jgi:hypothetical protein
MSKNCLWLNKGFLGLHNYGVFKGFYWRFFLVTYGQDYISVFFQQIPKDVMVPWKILILRTSLDLQLPFMMKKQLAVLTVSSQKANAMKNWNQLWVRIFSLFVPVHTDPLWQI